jgi:hypothetical protein
MRRSFDIGDKFQLSAEALENYGQKYAGKVFVVRQWFDHYVPSSRMAQDTHGHPGFDACAGSALYEADGLNFALYEREMEGAR